MIQINVSISNSHITVIHLRFIKNKFSLSNIFFFKTVKLNYFQLLPIGFFQARKPTTKWRLSESSTFQNILKNRKQLPAEIFVNILLLTKNLKQSYYHSAGSFIENNLNNEFKVEISLMAKWKIFWFQKTAFQYYWFLVAINVFLWDWVKVFVSQGWVQAEITIHYNSVLIS